MEIQFIGVNGLRCAECGAGENIYEIRFKEPEVSRNIEGRRRVELCNKCLSMFAHVMSTFNKEKEKV